MFRHIQTQKYKKWTDENTVYVKTKTKLLVARQVIRKMCADQATKNVWVDCSAKPLGKHWDYERENRWKIEMKHLFGECCKDTQG